MPAAHADLTAAVADRLPHARREGDALRLVCEYDMTAKREGTPYGLGHGNEMCATLMYYLQASRCSHPYAFLARVPLCL